MRSDTVSLPWNGAPPAVTSISPEAAASDLVSADLVSLDLASFDLPSVDLAAVPITRSRP